MSGKTILKVQELINLTCVQYNSKQRWELTSSHGTDMVDPRDGRVYHYQDYHTFSQPDSIWYHTEGPKEDKVTVEKRRDQLIGLDWEDFGLNETGEGFHREYIWLGADLGSQINEVWPKENRYGFETLSSHARYTLKGILRLLGIPLNEVEVEILRRKQAEERNNRNHARSWAVRQLEDMKTILDTVKKEIPEDQLTALYLAINVAQIVVTATMEKGE